MALPNNPTPNELVKAVKDLEQGGGSGGSGIQEITSQYVKITDLDTGIYKLTYNQSNHIYIQYYGGSITRTIDLPTSNGSYLLFVQKFNSNGYWNWELITNFSYDNALMANVIKYIGITTTSSGSFSQIRPANLVGVANTGNANGWTATQLPNTTEQIDLGSSTIQWNNIYGKTIYQDGKQVANAEDIPDISGKADRGYLTNASILDESLPSGIYGVNIATCSGLPSGVSSSAGYSEGMLIKPDINSAEYTGPVIFVAYRNAGGILTFVFDEGGDGWVKLANDNDVMHLTGNESIGGTKNFTGTFQINGGTISYNSSTDTFTI